MLCFRIEISTLNVALFSFQTLVEKCLVHIHDVPESELVRVVQYATDQISSGNPNAEKSGARKVEADDHAAERLLYATCVLCFILIRVIHRHFAVMQASRADCPAQ